MKRCSYCGKSYPEDQAVCPVDATPLEGPPPLPPFQVAAATAKRAPETLLPAAGPAKAALVTLVVFLVCLGAQKITIPTVGKAAADHPLLVANSILVLGVQPLLSGFVLVELAALLVPVWRPLRTGGRAGREKLRHASLIMGMILALGQAFFVAVALERTSYGGYGTGFRILTVLILLGATAALAALARVVDEEGLGGGFPILVLAFALPHIVGPLGHVYSAVQDDVLTRSVLPNGALGLALLVGATLWFFSPYSLPGNEPEDDPALLSRPACGVAPLSIVVAILAFVARLFTLVTRQTIFVPWQVEVVLSIVAAIGFAYLFNRPDRLRVVWKALSSPPPQRVPALKPVMLECVLFIGLVVLVQDWLDRSWGSNQVPDAISVILVTGIIADLIRELRARADGTRLVPIWEIHQVYAVPPAMRLLQAHGFHPFAKGLRLRSLLQFFGPYAPIVVLVPAGEAQAAYALLESRWPVLDQPDEPATPSNLNSQI